MATIDPNLTMMVTRLAIDRLRSARVRRETYVGPWLTEPLIGSVEPDPTDIVDRSPANCRQIAPKGTEVRIVRANGDIAIIGVANGTANGVLAFEIEDDTVTWMRAVLNPDKLPAGM